MLFVINEATKANDPVTYPNYFYILDIYVDGDIVARQRIAPDPTYKFGKADVSVILRDYVPAYGLKANYASDTEQYSINLTYHVELGEEYDGITYTNVVTDSDRTCYKTYAQRPYLSSDVIASKMNVSPSNRPVMSEAIMTAYKGDKWLLMPYIGNYSGVTVSCEFGSNGTIVGGGSVDFVYTDVFLGDVMQVNAGFEKLANDLGLTQSQKDSVTHLTITNNSSNTYKYVYRCPKLDSYTIAWINPYGAYESQSFGFVSKRNNGVSKKDFSKLPYQINASGEVSYDSDGVLYGSKRVYSANTKVLLSLTSHILTDDEYTWLADLFSSPDVYIFLTDLDRFVPCTIVDSSYDYRTYMNSRLTPLQFTVEFAEYNSQFL